MCYSRNVVIYIRMSSFQGIKLDILDVLFSYFYLFSVPPIGYKVWCFSNVYTTSGIIVVASMGDIGDRVL